MSSSVGQMYCLSPGAHESLGSYKLTSEDGYLQLFDLLVFQSLYPKQLTLPFIVQGESPYKGGLKVVSERERECLPRPSILSVGTTHFVGWGPQAVVAHVLCRGVVVSLCSCA